MDGNSLNITRDLLEKLKELVPQAFSEEKVDMQKLQTLLGEAVNSDNERYQLSWAGKSEAYKVLQMPTTATLITQPEQSVKWDESETVICLDSLFQGQDMVKTNAQLKLEDNGIAFKTV